MRGVTNTTAVPHPGTLLNNLNLGLCGHVSLFCYLWHLHRPRCWAVVLFKATTETLRFGVFCTYFVKILCSMGHSQVYTSCLGSFIAASRTSSTCLMLAPGSLCVRLWQPVDAALAQHRKAGLTQSHSANGAAFFLPGCLGLLSLPEALTVSLLLRSPLLALTVRGPHVHTRGYSPVGSFSYLRTCLDVLFLS